MIFSFINPPQNVLNAKLAMLRFFDHVVKLTSEELIDNTWLLGCWLSISSAVERAFLTPKDAAPMKLQGIDGSKKELHINESKASCVELKVRNLSIDR